MALVVIGLTCVWLNHKELPPRQNLGAPEFVDMWSKIKIKNLNPYLLCLKDLHEADSIQEIIPSSRVNIYSFAFPARSLEEASRPCSHLVMFFSLPRWINAGRSYNWWVMGSACRSSKIPKVWLFSDVDFCHHPPKGALSFPLLFPQWILKTVLQGQQGFQVVANLLKPNWWAL